MPIIQPKMPPRRKRAGFSRSYAQARGLPTGVEEAVIVRFLTHHVERATEAKRNLYDGKHWYYNSLAKLEAKTGIPDSTIYDALNRLVKDGQIIRGKFNKLRMDRTAWYWVPEPVRDAAERDIIYFDFAVARRLRSICAGVLYDNLVFQQRSRPGIWCRMSPQVLSRLLPFSESTIRRELKALVKANLIIADAFPNAFYRIPTPPEWKIVDGRVEPITPPKPTERPADEPSDVWLSDED